MKLFQVNSEGLLAIVILISCSVGCKKNEIPDLDLRQEMRSFVEEISSFAKSHSPGFIVIPQNGLELITLNGESTGAAAAKYLNSIDGQGCEDLFYGYTGDGSPTPSEDRIYMEGFLNRSKSEGKMILVTDYCSVHTDMLDSYLQNEARGYISFAADRRSLDHVPAFPPVPFNENWTDINSIGQVRNFLYLVNPGSFANKYYFLDSLAETSYDLLVIDLDFDTKITLTRSDIESLKTKPNGANRLVICYMSIGEAENYRYYWKPGWEFANPVWLDKPNPDWPGNYKVRYWEPEWQAIIFGNNDSYTKRIIDAGFDGVYLDGVDGFSFFDD